MANETDKIVKIDDDEWAAAKEEEEKSKSRITVSLAKPFEWEGETYSELVFDFDTLTGKDSMEIEREMRAKGIPLVTPAFSGEYLIRAAVRACTAELGIDALMALPMPTFNRIRTSVSAFLARAEI